MRKIKHLLNLKDYSSRDIQAILRKARAIKAKPGNYGRLLKNKTLIMLFQKTSTRTRLSFETAMTQLGGHAIFFDWRTSQFQIADYKDEIRATMRFGDALMFRPLKHQSLAEAAEVGNIPVINACCEKYHPCQALADALTMIEESKSNSLKGKKVLYAGIANNVSNSLAMVVTKLGGQMIMAVPETDPGAYDKELLSAVQESGLYEETDDFESALAEADFVHTDTWINMEFFDPVKHTVKSAFKKEFNRRKKLFAPLQLNARVLEKTKSKAKIMHCMPCHIGFEISRDAVEHPRSLIFRQAENRLHAQKGLLAWMLG